MTDARTARLLGDKDSPGSGGLLLPEVFREILATLFDEGPRPAENLRKIAKEMLPYKSERILDRWESWDAFGDELLDILCSSGFAEEAEGLWAVTDKAVPGEMLTVYRDPEDRSRRIRVTFTPRKSRESADAIAEAWRRIGEYTRWLDRKTTLSPVLLRARQKAAGISEILQEEMRHHPEKKKEEKHPDPGRSGRGPKRRDGLPRNSGQASWYREWIVTAGWHTQDDARKAWNRQFPERMIPNVSESSFRNVSRGMARRGEMEVREVGDRIDGRACAFKYRVTPPGR
jgi:hypothetical protein